MNIFGASLVLLTNCCYIANNYAVKWAGLGAGEVSLVRGALQVLVFSAALIISTRVKSHRNNNNSESQKCKISRKSLYLKCVSTCKLAQVTIISFFVDQIIRFQRLHHPPDRVWRMSWSACTGSSPPAPPSPWSPPSP